MCIWKYICVHVMVTCAHLLAGLMLDYRFEMERWNVSGRSAGVKREHVLPPEGKISILPAPQPTIAVLVIACDRKDYIKLCLDELLKYFCVCGWMGRGVWVGRGGWVRRGVWVGRGGWVRRGVSG